MMVPMMIFFVVRITDGVTDDDFAKDEEDGGR